MFEPKNTPAVADITSSRTPPVSEEILLDKKIETALRGKFIPPGFEDDIHDDFERRGLDTLKAKLHEVTTSLTSMGYLVDVRYCTSKLLDHPVPVLSVRNSAGHYSVPSFNVWWDPTIPREYDNGGSPSEPKHVITADNSEEADTSAWGDDLVSTRLHVELFSADAPVALLLVPSDSANTPIALKPLFSRSALREACLHGADTLLSGTQSRYAYVFHEVLSPAVGDHIREDSPLFGERETATFRNGVASEDGTTMGFTACYEDDQERIRMDAHIVENGLSLQAKLLVR